MTLRRLSGVLVPFVLACGDGEATDDGGGSTSASGSASTTIADTGTTASTTATSATTHADGDASASSSASATGTDTSASATTDSADSSGGSGAVDLPPPDGGLDYQLGGAYPPPDGVVIVSRDRAESPAAGLYNICYVNGFQAQEGEADWWLSEHPDLILRDGNGDPVIDADWNEMLLDTSTADKRTALAEIVGGWIVDCGGAGFDAVEIDNLDSYSRSMGLLTQDGAVEYMALLSATAHMGGLAIAQKNSTELVGRKDEMGTDFVVAEECNRYSECGDYIDVYGDAVLMIEYRQADFDMGCADYAAMSIVLRDLDLVTPDDAAYVYDGC